MNVNTKVTCLPNRRVMKVLLVWAVDTSCYFMGFHQFLNGKCSLTVAKD